MINQLIPQSTKNEKYPEPKGAAIRDLFVSFEPFKQFFLLIGFLLLIYIPILAIIPLLLYLQIHVSSGDKENDEANFHLARTKKIDQFTLIIFFVCITILSIYNSTIYRFADVSNYLNYFHQIYSRGFNESLEILKKIGIEPLSLIFPKLVIEFLELPEKSFLLITSFIDNTVIFFLTYILVPRFYPLIALINAITLGYYDQLFNLRHFFSYLFVVPFLFAENFWLLGFLFILSLQTHITSIIVAPTLLFKIPRIRVLLGNFLQNKYTKYFFLIVTLLLLFVGIYYQQQIFQFLINLGNILQFSQLSSKVEYYQSNFRRTIVPNKLQIVSFIILCFYVWKIDFSRLSSTKKGIITSLTVFLLLNIVLCIISVTFEYNHRIFYFLSALPGFFYLIPILSGQLERKGLTYNLFLIQLIIQLYVFLYFQLYVEQMKDFSTVVLEGGDTVFWEAEPLTSSCYEYIQHLINTLF